MPPDQHPNKGFGFQFKSQGIVLLSLDIFG